MSRSCSPPLREQRRAWPSSTCHDKSQADDGVCDAVLRRRDTIFRRSPLDRNEPMWPVAPTQPPRSEEYAREIIRVSRASPAFRIARVIYRLLSLVVGLIVIRV